MKKTTLSIIIALTMSVFGLQAQSWLNNSNGMYLSPTSTKLGIGTSSPNSMLHVNSPTSTEIPFRVQMQGSTKLLVSPNGGVTIGSATAGPADGLFVSGNVGIGATTPAHKLDVNGWVSAHSYVVGRGNNQFVIHARNWLPNDPPELFIAPKVPNSNNEFDYSKQIAIKNDGSLIMHGGNLGIGTAAISNDQDWEKVLDVYAPNFSKLLVRGSTVQTGIFSHNSWNGTVGRIGTESIHDLRLMAGYNNDIMTLKTNGNVGIGYTNPTTKLDVNGTIRAHEVRVCVNQGCDYVFEPDYSLMSLSDLSHFIKANKHLPEVAPAVIMESEGISVSEMSTLLLKKVEELTLYIIAQDEKMKILEIEMNKLKNK